MSQAFVSGCGVSSLFHLNLFDMSLFEKSVENPSYVSILIGLMQSSVRSSLSHKVFSHNHDNFKLNIFEDTLIASAHVDSFRWSYKLQIAAKHQEGRYTVNLHRIWRLTILWNAQSLNGQENSASLWNILLPMALKSLCCPLWYLDICMLMTMLLQIKCLHKKGVYGGKCHTCCWTCIWLTPLFKPIINSVFWFGFLISIGWGSSFSHGCWWVLVFRLDLKYSLSLY